MTTSRLLIYLSIPVFYFVLVGTRDVFELPLTVEDGIVENVGSIFFLLASVLFLYLYYKSSSRENAFFGKALNRNIYLLLLGLLLFVVFGEEISWGQRIFGWQTPEGLAEMNAQKETNFHNLWLFQSYTPDGSGKSFAESLLNMNRLFSIFWLTFCVVVPLLHKTSGIARRLIDFTGVPLAPIWVGGLFLANFFIFHLFASSLVEPAYPRLDEAKESVYGAIYFVLAVAFFQERKLSG